MGVPITLNSPVGSNFIKDWPALNATNCDIIDDAAGPCLVGQPLTPYTPVLKGTTTDPVLGTNGILHGFFYRAWDQIYCWGEFRFGTAGINIGSGVYTVSIPAAADGSLIGSTSFPGGGSVVGNGIVWDASTDSGKRPLVAQLRDNFTLQFMHPTGDSGSELINSGSPVTWTFSDGVSWSVAYKRAS